MKEKKYLRLLPFRAQDDSRRAGDDGGRLEWHDDDELSRLLHKWEAPDAPRATDARLLASFRRETAIAAPFRRRFWNASVSVPLPVAALAVLALLCITATLLVRPFRLSRETAGEVAPHASETTKVIEVPVIQERIVYVERGARRKQSARDENFSERRPSQQRVRQQATSPQPLARGERRSAPDAETHGTGYFTRVNMEEFHPANQMQIRVIKRGNGDEK
ncbi:MAG TPA: hypothetical protein VGV59_06835 [Pyrinomonadaceae bacterium]|nr:hypothetical protein [Pyrinomonadaceae bacterium]